MYVEKVLIKSLWDNPSEYQGKSIAVHIHLFYQDLIPEFVKLLQNIPVPFDILCSIPENVEADDKNIETSFKEIPCVNSVIIKHTTNRGRDVAPMLCSFGEEIVQHDFLLHFHTKKSPHDKTQNGWRIFMLEHLLGSKDIVCKILTSLSETTGIVSAPDFLFNVTADKWSNENNLPEAQKVIDRSSLNVNLKEEYPVIDFPQGSFFWARTDFLKEMFRVGLKYEDFPEEPIPVDGTIAHGLERLFFVWGRETTLHPMKVFLSESEMAYCSHAREMYLSVADIVEGKVNPKDGYINQLKQDLDRVTHKNKKHLKQLRKLIFVSSVLFLALLISIGIIIF